MNEQIRELAEQCYYPYEEHHIDLAQFVERVVKKCMDICEQQRRKILQNPNDPSWTEHLAECQTNMQKLID